MQTHLTALLSTGMRGEPSEAQQAKVRRLQRIEEARRKLGKSRRSEVKAGRRGGGGGWD
jgi:peptidyl-tRNA hydrolase ICT1